MSLILLSLISLGCQTKIKRGIIYNPCPILKSIDKVKALELHKVDFDTTERLFKNINLLIASTNCDYTKFNQWEY